MSTYLKQIDRHVQVEDNGCWRLLTLVKHRPIALLSNGYTPVTVSGVRVLGHRWVWEAFNGPIPDGLVIDHLCRNPACVNPAHLEPVLQRENLLRGDTFQARNASKTECPQGHQYDEANLIRSKDGRRKCKACHRERARAMRVGV